MTRHGPGGASHGDAVIVSKDDYDANRLVYDVTDGHIVILQARDHY